MLLTLVDQAHGVYIPQIAARDLREFQHNISYEDLQVLLAGPDHEYYWDVWEDVLSYARIIGRTDGKTYELYHEGDLFLMERRHE